MQEYIQKSVNDDNICAMVCAHVPLFHVCILEDMRAPKVITTNKPVVVNHVVHQHLYSCSHKVASIHILTGTNEFSSQCTCCRVSFCTWVFGNMFLPFGFAQRSKGAHRASKNVMALQFNITGAHSFVVILQVMSWCTFHACHLQKARYHAVQFFLCADSREGYVNFSLQLSHNKDIGV